MGRTDRPVAQPDHTDRDVVQRAALHPPTHHTADADVIRANILKDSPCSNYRLPSMVMVPLSRPGLGRKVDPTHPHHKANVQRAVVSAVEHLPPVQVSAWHGGLVAGRRWQWLGVQRSGFGGSGNFTVFCVLCSVLCGGSRSVVEGVGHLEGLTTWTIIRYDGPIPLGL